jgi:ppGpp synthetase/RelA/SpoT-type nucleotidyltranferase
MLEEAQFGYQSHHVIVRLPRDLPCGVPLRRHLHLVIGDHTA